MKVKTNRLEMLVLLVLGVIAIISSITTVVGFGANNLGLIILSARFLSLSTLILLSWFGYRVYQEMKTDVREIRLESYSKEDIEEFRKKLDLEIQQYIKNIAEEEELDKDE